MISEAEVLAGLAFLEIHAPPECVAAIRMARGACEVAVASARIARMQSQPLDVLRLSMRSLTTMTRLGFKTVGDVEAFVTQHPTEILQQGKVYNFGKRCLREVQDKLFEQGIATYRRDARPG